jgi:hypothetical protein
LGENPGGESMNFESLRCMIQVEVSFQFLLVVAEVGKKSGHIFALSDTIP